MNAALMWVRRVFGGEVDAAAEAASPAIAPGPVRRIGQALLLAAVLGLAVYLSWDYWTHRRPAQAGRVSGPSLSAPAPPQQRRTFDTSTQGLIDRYNAVARNVDRTMLLPPSNAMEEMACGKPGCRALRHQVSLRSWVVLEEDRTTGRPYAMQVWSAASGDAGDSVRFAVLLAAVGATFLGTTGQASHFIQLCASVPLPAGTTQESQLDGLVMQCGNAGGIWIAGFATV